MNATIRWQLAQNYEHAWWKKKTGFVKADYYRNSAAEVRDFYSRQKKMSTDTHILEIGSGAAGILTFLTESNERYAIDPLETYYSTVDEFIKIRDKKVKYSANKGEELPFDNKMFDLLIVDNVLDHCEQPENVLAEMKRVLKTNGFIYFRQNTYNWWGKTLRTIMEFFVIDKGHPYTFTKTNLKVFFEKYCFTPIIKTHNGYFSTWKSEMTSGNTKDFIKAILFVTRDKTTLLLKNS